MKPREYIPIVLSFLSLAVIVTVLAAVCDAQQDKPTQATTTTVTTTTTTTPPTTKAPKKVHFPLTDAERDLVKRVVMAEAGAEPFEGQMAVAQCILNASRMTGTRPPQVLVELQYTKARPEPTEKVKQAVAAVFDDGAKVFGEDVIYFYAPALVKSDWHESQVYVTTIGCHKFFKEAR